MNVLIDIKVKNIEVDGRKFQIRKFNPVSGMIVGKTIIAKILPAMQSFIPVIKLAAGGDKNAIDDIFNRIDEFLNLEMIANALDLVSPSDLEDIIARSLACCYEVLGAGPARVLNPDGTYGVAGVEDDILISLRLICEAILWGVGDFFDVDRSLSILSPLSSSLPQSQQT